MDPFEINHSVEYIHDMEEWSGLADLEAFDEDDRDSWRVGQALVTTAMKLTGSSTVIIERMKMMRSVRHLLRRLSYYT